MDIYRPDEFFKAFPNLDPRRTNVTSPVDRRYNCIAWAVGENKRWWWPSPYSYWPTGVARLVTVDAFVAAYATIGFRPVAKSDWGDSDDCLALYTLNSVPTHAARRLPNGKWTSKCGQNVDIEHDLADLDGPLYGTATHFFLRARR